MNKRRVELRIEPLQRELLAGVRDPEDEARRLQVDVGIVPWFEDERPLQGLAGFLDWRSNGRLSTMLRRGWGLGRFGESILMPWHHGGPVRRLVLVGFGRIASLTAETAAAGVTRAVTVANGLSPEHALFAIPGPIQERELVEALFEGLGAAIERGVGRRPEAPRAIAPAAPAEADPEADEPVATPANDGGGPSPSISSVVAELHPAPERWWVVVDPRHAPRLRRLLEGPPRAAES